MKTFLETYNKCLLHICKKQLYCALKESKTLVDRLANWNIIQEHESILRNYSLLLQYFQNGVKDPTRDELREDFLRKTLILIDTALYNFASINSNSKYAECIRTCKATSFQLKDALDEFERLEQESIISSMISPEKGNTDGKKEALMNNIFNQVWSSCYWDTNTSKAAENYLMDNTASKDMRLLLISSVSLAAIYHFDIEKVRVLIHSCTSKTLYLRSFIGLILISLYRQKHLRCYPEITNSIYQQINRPEIKEQLIVIQKQLLNIKNIESFRKILNQNLMSSISTKQDSDVNISIIQDIINDDISEELMEDPSIKKLKNNINELMEMQSENIDIPYFTFSHLKHFHFFSKASHWFFPFSITYAPNGNMQDNPSFIDVFIKSNRLCDSDKYSFLFFIQHMQPSDVRQMVDSLKQQLGEENIDNIYVELEDRKENFIHYLQDCFRFFNIYPQRSTSNINPFKENLYLFNNELFHTFFNDKETLLNIVRYAHKHNMHDDVINILEYIDNNYNLDVESLQIYGYHLLKKKSYNNALLCLEKASIIDPNSTWTLSNLAHCYLKTNNVPKALSTYSKLLHISPENIPAILHYGECLYLERKYEKAIEQFHKVEYLNPNSTKAIRAIAYCSLENLDAHQSDKYYDKLAKLKRENDDLRNAGHAAWAIGHIEKAIKLYKQAKLDSYFIFTNKETTLLATYGISREDMLLMQDAINEE